MIDLTKLTLVKHKNAFPKPEKEPKGSKPIKDEPYKILIKAKKIDTVKEKIRITVKDLSTGYVYCVTTALKEKYKGVIDKFERKYRKLGKVKIEDDN